MANNIDYGQAPLPSDSQSRRQLRFMIVFAQLICLPFFPKPLTIFPPFQAVAIAAIGLAAISFDGNVLLWALSVPRKFSIRSAVIKVLIGLFPFRHRVSRGA